MIEKLKKAYVRIFEMRKFHYDDMPFLFGYIY